MIRMFYRAITLCLIKPTYFFLLIQLGLSCKISAQTSYTIKGNITDAQTNESINYASVYLSQTTIGSNTDEHGNYTIRNVHAGKYLLIASMIGYKPEIKEIVLGENRATTFDFKLEQIIYEYNQIEITGGSTEKRQEELNLFKKYFIGENKFSDKCAILNEDKIIFTDNGNDFIVKINEPLKVANAALGYDIECLLYSFKYNGNTHSASYQIFPRFIEKTIQSEDTLEYYSENRNNAYLGSIAHFLTSVVNNTLYYEGFKLTSNTFFGASGFYDSQKIMTYNQYTHKYFLQFSGPLKIEYSDSYKTQSSWIQLIHNSAEFDPSGYFINPDEFIIEGDFTKGGISCMLPLNWKLHN